LFRGRESWDTGPLTPAAASPTAVPRPQAPAPWIARLARHRAWIEAHCHRIDLAPDLAQDIGSPRWLRGFATMLGLSFAALSFWPDFSAVEAATSPLADRSTRDEFRSQMIMPLAFGGDSGRRMGASAAVQPLANVPERAQIKLVATMNQGDSFGRMLQRAGVSPADAGRAEQLVAATMPLGEIGSGTRFDVVLGRRVAAGAPRSLERIAFRARFDLDLAVVRRGGDLALAARPLAVDATPLRIRGVVGPSLYRSARAAGAPMKAIQQYLQTLDGHVSLDGEVASTDKFDFIVAYKRSASGESETGELLYAGLERSGKPLAQLVRWGPDGQFFDAAGSGGTSQQASVFAPVAGRMTSGYGMRRHPILGYARLHAGVDFGAAWGSPIFAVSDAVVSYAGRRGGHGNYVRLEHGGGLGTGYGHMSKIAVSPGAHVRAGQVIGYVGSTGLSTGPHLHWEVYRDGRTVNPLSVRFAAKAQTVDPAQAKALKARLAQLKAIQPGAALKSLAPRQAVTR
jgi:murein DD-endopeptidase MepM/ murein hydrolase activator NlpD